MIEVASGETIDQYLRQSLFEPLGMTSTYAYWRGQPRKGLPPLVRKENRVLGNRAGIRGAFRFGLFKLGFHRVGLREILPNVSQSWNLQRSASNERELGKAGHIHYCAECACLSDT